MVQYGEPVRPVKEVEAVGMEVSPKGETIIDFGQNLAGTAGKGGFARRNKVDTRSL